MKFLSNILKSATLSLVIAGAVVLPAKAQYSYPSGNVTVSGTVLAGTMTNFVTGPFKLTELVLAATNSLGTTVIIVDTSTNSTTFTTIAYTNISYNLTNINNLTNQYSPFYYTNYYNVITVISNTAGSLSQFVIVESTNSVPATTANLPSITMSASTVPTVVNNLNQNYYRGIWVTNSSATNATLTLIGTRL
jgi:hypothetical protein